MEELTESWHDLLSPFETNGVVNYPLDLPTLLSRNDELNDYQHIPWKSLLAGNEENLPRLSFFKSQNLLTSPDVEVWIQ